MKKILIMAMTLNGLIAKEKNHMTDWTCKEDKKFFVEQTKKAGVIIMGRNTYDTIGRPLPNRLNIVLTEHPESFESIDGLLEYKTGDLEIILTDLEKIGFKEVIIAGGSFVNSAFLQKKLIDEMYITVEPKIFGKGLNLFAECDVDCDLELIETERIGENAVVLKYKKKKNNL